jgi:tripartite motif-containing protein 2/3
MLDMLAIERMNLECTSCKTVEKAIARCADCALFLCPNCVSAHKYMRCFEKHHVVALEDIINSFKNSLKSASEEYHKKLDSQPVRVVGGGVPIHKPVYCRLHPLEHLKIYCNSCQVKLYFIYFII